MNFHNAFIDELVKIAGEIGQAANTLAAVQSRIPASNWLAGRPSLGALTQQARSNALKQIRIRRELGYPNPRIRSEILANIKGATRAASLY